MGVADEAAPKHHAGAERDEDERPDQPAEMNMDRRGGVEKHRHANPEKDNPGDHRRGAVSGDVVILLFHFHGHTHSYRYRSSACSQPASSTTIARATAPYRCAATASATPAGWVT